jgi:hypothetical protein
MFSVENAKHGRLEFADGPEDIKWSSAARERGFVEVAKPCGRCGGSGGWEGWRHTGFWCYDCGGAGVHRKRRKIYTVERRAELDRINEKRRATLSKKREAEEAAYRAEREAEEVARKSEHAGAFEILDPVIEAFRELIESKPCPDAANELEAAGHCPFVVDVARKWARGKKVTDAMLEAVPGAAEKWAAGAERKAERERLEAERIANAVRVAEVAGNGAELTGRILGIKDKENDYGVETKMLFEDERGFRLWGTVPRALLRALIDAGALSYERSGGDYDGDRYWHLAEERPRVAFVANVEESDDEVFGFFKRPRRAELLEAAATKEGK